MKTIKSIDILAKSEIYFNRKRYNQMKFVESINDFTTKNMIVDFNLGQTHDNYVKDYQLQDKLTNSVEDRKYINIITKHSSILKQYSKYTLNWKYSQIQGKNPI